MMLGLSPCMCSPSFPALLCPGRLTSGDDGTEAQAESGMQEEKEAGSSCFPHSFPSGPPVWGGCVPLGPSTHGSQLPWAARPPPTPSQGWQWLLIVIYPGLFTSPCGFS